MKLNSERSHKERGGGRISVWNRTAPCLQPHLQSLLGSFHSRIPTEWNSSIFPPIQCQGQAQCQSPSPTWNFPSPHLVYADPTHSLLSYVLLVSFDYNLMFSYILFNILLSFVYEDFLFIFFYLRNFASLFLVSTLGHRVCVSSLIPILMERSLPQRTGMGWSR